MSKLLEYGVWLHRPLMMVEIILPVCTLTLGFVGITRYVKCWEQSYTFFVFILLLFSVLSYTSTGSIMDSLEEIYFPIFAYDLSPYLYNVQTGFNCIAWDNCKEQIVSEIGDYPKFCKKYLMCSIILLSVYFAFNLFLSLFVSLDNNGANSIREDDD